MAKSGITKQFLAEVVKFLNELETCVALSAFLNKPIIIPRVFVSDLIVSQSDCGSIWVVRYLNTQCVLRF